jgi:hypothetical protein
VCLLRKSNEPEGAASRGRLIPFAGGGSNVVLGQHRLVLSFVASWPASRSSSLDVSLTWARAMWSSARLESSYVQAKPSMPSIGFSITVMAEVVDGGRFVGGSG